MGNMKLLKIYTSALMTWMCLDIRYMVVTTSSSSCNFESIGAKNKNSWNCSSLGFKEFPSSIPDTTVLLNINNNNIKALQTYSSVKVLTLKSLDLSFNFLKNIHLNFFDNFPNLKFLDLSNNNLLTISCHFPQFLEILIVKNNKLHSIEDMNTSENFTDVDLQSNENLSNAKPSQFLHLEVLDVSNNQIDSIHQCWLDNFPSLKYLNLTKNQISVFLNVKCENNMQKLEVLDLSDNVISNIVPGAFQNLQTLKYLSLSRNRLRSIPEDVPTINWLDISYNEILSLSESTHRKDLYPHDVFLIGGNPFHCDCRIQWLKELFDTRKYLLKFIDVARDKFVPTCKSPINMTDASWEDVTYEDFNCDLYSDNIGKDTSANSLQEAQSETRNFHITLEATNVGHNFVKLQWLKDGDMFLNSEERLDLTYHLFGKKNSKKKIIISNAGRFTLKELLPMTAYIICLSHSKGDTTQSSDCIEVVTEAVPSHGTSERSNFTWTSVISVMVLATFLIYWLIFQCFGEENLSNETTNSELKKTQ